MRWAALRRLFLFHNAPTAGSVYTHDVQRLLPLDEAWQHDLVALPWPTRNFARGVATGRIRAVGFRARIPVCSTVSCTCAQSLASENASRLAAMQRAEKNIDELMDDLNRSFHRLRQNGIDEEYSTSFPASGTCSKQTNTKGNTMRLKNQNRRVSSSYDRVNLRNGQPLQSQSTKPRPRTVISLTPRLMS